MAKPVILIVDDEIEDKKWVRLLTFVRSCLPGWELRTAAVLETALDLIPTLPNLRLAIVDLFLTYPPVREDGIDVLTAIQRINADCFRILVSAQRKEEILGDRRCFDAFIYLQNTSCQEELHEAIELAKKLVAFPKDSHSAPTSVAPSL